MPYSSESGKAWIERMIMRLLPTITNRSLLDVGAGSGTYSNLLRPKLPDVRFEAVEVWETYRSRFSLDNKYDAVYQQDIRQFEPAKTYGLVICGDILEHMTQEEAIQTYTKLLQHSEYVIISIPIIPYPQNEFLQNPYEAHIKPDWDHEQVLAAFSNIACWHIDKEIGVYVSCNPAFHQAEEVLQASRPRYAIYGIFKDEEKFMRRFLNAAMDADEIVLCDTGSKDGSMARFERFKKKNPQVNLRICRIFVSPWRFDDARNTALSLVGSDMDVCISLDLDEYLLPGWRDILDRAYKPEYTRYHHMFRTLWPDGGIREHKHERIHTRMGYTWKLPVHEILEYSGSEVVCNMDDLWMVQEPDEGKSRSSYLMLLQQSVQERPDVWKSWSFLAGEYLNSERMQEALDALDKAMSLGDADLGYLEKMKFFIYQAQGDVPRALHALNSAIAHMPDRREPYYDKAMYLSSLNRHTEAYFTLREAKKRETRCIDYHDNADCWNASFDELVKEVRQSAMEEDLLL